MPTQQIDSYGGGSSFNTAVLTQGSTTLNFPYNPNTTQWQYTLNTQYMSTYGGYVEQLLSVSTQNILFEGDAGSRKRLLKLYAELLHLQELQIQTQASAHLVIPTHLEESGSISLNVWFANITLGIDPTTTTHPYRVLFQIKDSNYSKLNDQILSAELSKITESLSFGDGIGFYDNGFYQGLNKESKLTMNQFSDLIYANNTNIATQGSWNF